MGLCRFGTCVFLLGRGHACNAIVAGLRLFFSVSWGHPSVTESIVAAHGSDANFLRIRWGFAVLGPFSFSLGHPSVTESIVAAHGSDANFLRIRWHFAVLGPVFFYLAVAMAAMPLLLGCVCFFFFFRASKRDGKHCGSTWFWCRFSSN